MGADLAEIEDTRRSFQEIVDEISRLKIHVESIDAKDEAQLPNIHGLNAQISALRWAINEI